MIFFTQVVLITAGCLRCCHGYPQRTTVSAGTITEVSNSTDYTPPPRQTDSLVSSNFNTTVSTTTQNLSEQSTTKEAAILADVSVITATEATAITTETANGKNFTLHPFVYHRCQENDSYCNDHGQCFENYDQTLKFCRCDKNYSGETCEAENKSKVFEKLLFGIGILCLLFLVVLLIIANQLHQKVCEYENFKIEVEQLKKETEKMKEQSTPKQNKPLKLKAFKTAKLPKKKAFKRTITGRKPKSSHKNFPKFFPDQMPVIVESESAESSPKIENRFDRQDNRFHQQDNSKEAATAYDDAVLSSASAVYEPDALVGTIVCDENTSDRDPIIQNTVSPLEYNPRSYIQIKQSSGHTSKNNLESFSSHEADFNENSWKYELLKADMNSLYNSGVPQLNESPTVNNQIVVTAQIHDSPV